MGKFYQSTILTILISFSFVDAERPVIDTQYSDNELLSLSKKEIIGSTVIVFIFSLIVGLFLFFADNSFVQLYKLIN